MSYETKTIMAALGHIHRRELVLPGIQRDFVWQPERIYKLLDSILRGYPFGTLLFWNTKQRLQYREFTKDWDSDQGYIFHIKNEGVMGSVVLDGQQRLQSLYLAIHGHYEGKCLYFDLLSGDDQPDLSEPKYHFEFLQADKVEDTNRRHRGEQCWVPLRDLANIPGAAQLALKAQQYLAQAGVEAASEAGKRLSQNVHNAFLKLRAEELLNYYTVDKDGEEYGPPTSLDEVLEIFVRINSGGQVLSKSDLMFSLMQLHWEGAANSIDSLCDGLNRKNLFEFDKDFVLKCALVCCGRGARYDVEKLRKAETVQDLEDAFPRISDALIACVDWVMNTARLRDGRVLGSYNALIPFVYFFYLQPGQKAKGESTKLVMNQALYLVLMTRFFSRYADSRIDPLVQKVLNPAHQSSPWQFPLEEVRRFISTYREPTIIDDALLQKNVPLLMNILALGSPLPEGTEHRRPEYDHIFPKAKLEAFGYAPEQINHYANFRLIPRSDHEPKVDKDPNLYFKDHPEITGRYLIPPEYLDYGQFPEFLEARSKRIWAQVRAFLGIQPGEAGILTPLSSYQPVESAAGGSPVAPADRHEVVRRVFTRIPVAEGARAVLLALWGAGEQGLSSTELTTASHRTSRELAGVLGALGNRINHTDGVAAVHPDGGIGLLLEWWLEQSEWRYRLKPDFRQALSNDPELARLATGREG